MRNRIIFYIIYDNISYTKGIFTKSLVQECRITYVGTTGATVNDLLDHYCFNSVAVFECLVPSDELLEYLKFIKETNSYHYYKVLNFMIELANTSKKSLDDNLYLNLFGLEEFKY